MGPVGPVGRIRPTGPTPLVSVTPALQSPGYNPSSNRVVGSPSFPDRGGSAMVRTFALLAAALVVAQPALAAPVPMPKKVNVEVVFCLDTTGSMGGLIDGAKA